jgi:hypothetical protein
MSKMQCVPYPPRARHIHVKIIPSLKPIKTHSCKLDLLKSEGQMWTNIVRLGPAEKTLFMTEDNQAIFSFQRLIKMNARPGREVSGA